MEVGFGVGNALFHFLSAAEVLRGKALNPQFPCGTSNHLAVSQNRISLKRD